MYRHVHLSVSIVPDVQAWTLAAFQISANVKSWLSQIFCAAVVDSQKHVRERKENLNENRKDGKISKDE